MAKQEYSSTDAQPVALYARSNASSTLVSPLVATSSGALLISAGIDFPSYDALKLSYSGSNLSTVQFYVGGTGGTLVATLSLGYSGSNLASVART